MADNISTLAAKLRPFWLRDDANVTTVAAGGTAGITDHGALSGLLDDDHTQYLTNARGDARYLSTLSAGAGLTLTMTPVITLDVGVSGLGLGVGADAVTLTSSSSPGAAASILASSGAGLLTLYNGAFTQAASSAATFATGFAGSGWRVDYGITTANKASAEFDDLTVRGRMRVYELLIQQIRATNGSVFVSSASKVVGVTTATNPAWTVNGTPLTFNGTPAELSTTLYDITTAKTTGATDTDGGSNDRRLYHGFLYGDVIRAQQVRWDGAAFAGVIQSNLEVTSVAGLYTYGAAFVSGDAPAVGFDYVRLGNSSDTSRQGSVYLTSDDSAAPFIDIVDGVRYHTDWNSASVRRVRVGKLTGISDAAFGGALSGYGLYGDNVYLRGQMVVTGGSLGGLAAADVNSNTTTIDGGHITANSINASQIVAGAITAEKIGVLSLSAITANMGTLTTGSIVIGSANQLWLNDGADGALNIGGNIKTDAPFRVTASGALTATGANITGQFDITGNSVITGGLATTGSIYAGNNSVRLSTDGIRMKLLTDTAPNIPTSTAAMRWMLTTTDAWTNAANYGGIVSYYNTSTSPDVVDVNVTSVVGDDFDTATDARVVLQAGHYAGGTYTDAYLIVTREAGGGARTVNVGCDTFNASNNVYVTGNMSALTITDRTPFYDGDAVAELREVRGIAPLARGDASNDGESELDHDSLPVFARKRVYNHVTKEERDERDIGAMVSILTTAVQQLDARLSAIEGK
jgi:hypothetical protein